MSFIEGWYVNFSPMHCKKQTGTSKEKGRCPVLSENKHRRAASGGLAGRLRQSARHIEAEAVEGAHRLEHNAQERVRSMTPHQRSSWRRAGHIVGTLLLVFVLTSAIFAGIFMAYINSTMRGKVEVYLDEFEAQVSTELYYQDPDTQEWVMYQTLYMDENRIWTDLENIPKYLQDAAIAIEDKRFEKHHGVDWKGTTRAIFRTIFGGSVQGGSTITQQLVKNVTGDNEVTVKRKITEIYRALELEKRYTKDEILEAYLNEVYFGQRCSGVMTAAQVYFGKDVSELTLAECASMMGITNNPSMYDPFISTWTRENNRERQLIILSEMLDQGKISQEEHDAAVAEDIQFANGYTISGKYVGSDGTVTDPDTDTADTAGDTSTDEEESTSTIKGSNSWFTDAMITDVAEALVEKLGITEKVNSEGKTISAYDQAINMVYSKGYKIYTTQNPKYQQIAEEVCYNLDNIPYTSSYTNSAGEQVEDQLQIALTVVDPTNGYVVAMIGGAGEKVVDRGWNWAVNARQCGSAIKPLSTYAPALDDGTINGASVIDDYPMLLNGDVWPRNFDWRYRGLTALHTALAQSLNTCAVRTNMAYGVSRSYDFLVNKLGFENLTYTDSQQVGNMALGGFEKGVTTEEMAAAFATFVNEGIYTKPRTFIRVEDANGNVVLENEAQSNVAIKNTTAAIVNKLLQEVALVGTGNEAQFSGMHIAGKTGSTNSNRDRYFVGYTPYYACAVWAGYEHNQQIVASGNPCSAIFRKVMSAIHADLEDKDFFTCSGLTSVTVCADSGMLASEYCTLDVRGDRTYTALCASDNVPTSVCTMHTTPTHTVNMEDSDGNITTVTGSMLNYQRELIEGHDEIEVEDAFMMVGYSAFIGSEEQDDNDNVNMPDGRHDSTVVGSTDTDDLPSDVDEFIHSGG